MTPEQVQALLADLDGQDTDAHIRAFYRIKRNPLPAYRLALFLDDQLQRERARAEAAERALGEERRLHHLTLIGRDRAEETADRLAYALYDVDEIGEHSSLNDPWQNAAERLEARAALAPTPADAPEPGGSIEDAGE